MRVIITGGGGFIGSGLVRHLILNTDYTVLVIDDFNEQKKARLSMVSESSRYESRQMEIEDESLFIEIFKTFCPQIVFHLAETNNFNSNMDETKSLITKNIVGTHTILEACRVYWSQLNSMEQPKFRFVYLSDEGASDMEMDRDLNQFSPYHASKLCAESLIRAWRETYGIPSVITTKSHCYGPYQPIDELIPTVIMCALRGESIQIDAQKMKHHPWLFIGDLACGLVASAERGVVGQRYHMSSHRVWGMNEVIYRLCELLQYWRPRRGGYFELVSDQSIFNTMLQMPSSSIQDIGLGWQPVVSFEEGLSETVRWYLSNSEWCGL